jgi:C-terminal processing protease CtpA/Prc
MKTSAILKAQVHQRDDTTSAYWQKILREPVGTVYNYQFEDYQPQPKEQRFHGDVYVLINRQSHSQSAVTAAQIQDYGFGTLVGEETGEYPSLYASGLGYTLPNTGIPVNVSKAYMLRVNGRKAERGVMPDIFIKDHLLDEEDEVLQSLLERLK